MKKKFATSCALCFCAALAFGMVACSTGATTSDSSTSTENASTTASSVSTEDANATSSAASTENASEAASTSTASTTGEASDYPSQVPAYEFVADSQYSTKELAQSSFTADEVGDLYAFTLQNAQYQLPCSIEEFTTNGWASADDALSVAPNMLASNEVFYLRGNQNTKIYLDLLNESNRTAAWDACTVVGVTVEYETAPTFETSQGIKLGSSLDEVESIYGGSDYDIDRFGGLGYHFLSRLGDTYTSYQWYGQNADTLSFYETCGWYPEWEDTKLVDHIHMQYFGDIEPSGEISHETTETNAGEVVNLH